MVVTCLLCNEGGWWSPSCVQTAVMPYQMEPDLASGLVRACLAELVRDGHASVCYPGPRWQPLFRWVG